jgi:hypothetical protein
MITTKCKFMQGFIGEPEVEILSDGINMRLSHDFAYIDKAGGAHVARKGLKTNGGSIPRIFWRVIGSPWTGQRRYAYVIHDQECTDVYELPASKQTEARKKADDMLYEMCRFLGDSAIAAWTVWMGVRIGWKFSRKKG